MAELLRRTLFIIFCLLVILRPLMQCMLHASSCFVLCALLVGLYIDTYLFTYLTYTLQCTVLLVPLVSFIVLSFLGIHITDILYLVGACHLTYRCGYAADHSVSFCGPLSMIKLRPVMASTSSPLSIGRIFSR